MKGVLHLFLTTNRDVAGFSLIPSLTELADDDSVLDPGLFGELTQDGIFGGLARLDTARWHLRTRTRIAHVLEDQEASCRVGQVSSGPLIAVRWPSGHRMNVPPQAAVRPPPVLVYHGVVSGGV